MIPMNYFAAEKPIVERLQALGIFKKVQGWSTAEEARSQGEIYPRAFVIYDGGNPSNVGPSSTLLDQNWTVIINVKKSATGDSQQAARDDAGMLIAKVIQSLSGFTPAERHRALALSGPIRPEYYEGGQAAFALTFVTNRPAI